MCLVTVNYFLNTTRPCPGTAVSCWILYWITSLGQITVHWYVTGYMYGMLLSVNNSKLLVSPFRSLKDLLILHVGRVKVQYADVISIIGFSRALKRQADIVTSVNTHPSLGT